MADVEGERDLRIIMPQTAYPRGLAALGIAAVGGRHQRRLEPAAIAACQPYPVGQGGDGADRLGMRSQGRECREAPRHCIGQIDVMDVVAEGAAAQFGGIECDLRRPHQAPRGIDQSQALKRRGAWLQLVPDANGAQDFDRSAHQRAGPRIAPGRRRRKQVDAGAGASHQQRAGQSRRSAADNGNLPASVHLVLQLPEPAGRLPLCGASSHTAAAAGTTLARLIACSTKTGLRLYMRVGDGK